MHVLFPVKENVWKNLDISTSRSFTEILLGKRASEDQFKDSLLVETLYREMEQSDSQC